MPHWPEKTIRLSEREIERWQRAADLAGLTLTELITAATTARVDRVERDHAADLKLDEYVPPVCGCGRCAGAEERQ